MWWRSRMGFEVSEDNKSARFHVNGRETPPMFSKNQARGWVASAEDVGLISSKRGEQLRRLIDATDLPEMSDEEIEEAKPARFELSTLERSRFAAIPHGVMIGPKAKRLAIACSKTVAIDILGRAIGDGYIQEADRERITAEINATSLPEAETDVDRLFKIAAEVRAGRRFRPAESLMIITVRL